MNDPRPPSGADDDRRAHDEGGDAAELTADADPGWLADLVAGARAGRDATAGTADDHDGADDDDVTRDAPDELVRSIRAELGGRPVAAAVDPPPVPFPAPAPEPRAVVAPPPDPPTDAPPPAPAPPPVTAGERWQPTGRLVASAPLAPDVPIGGPPPHRRTSDAAKVAIAAIAAIALVVVTWLVVGGGDDDAPAPAPDGTVVDGTLVEGTLVDGTVTPGTAAP